MGDTIKTFRCDKMFDVTEVGVFSPKLTPKENLQAGEVGYIAASIKSILDVAVGDTVTNANVPAEQPLPGYKKVQPSYSAAFILWTAANSTISRRRS